MKFLSDILAKAGLTVDGVVTLNNTATGQTPDANDNSTKLATTAWVRTFVQPYSLPIASASILGGVKVGSGLSINSSTGVLSVVGASAASIKSTQTFVVTEGQTVFTVTGGYTPGLIDIFLNGVYLSPNQTVATNGTTFTINDPAAAGDIVDVIVASAIFEGSASTTDQLPEGSINLYYTNTRARAAITLTTTGVSGAATYNSSTGVFNIPNYQGLVPAGGVAGDILAKVSGTNYDVTWIPNFTSTVQHTVKAAVSLTKGQAVYVSSADGTNMIVSKASNASEQTSSKTLGLVAQNLAINGQGFVVTEGLLAGLDTSTAQAGDPVWLGTDGNLIYGLANKPYAPAHLVFIGIVTRVQQNNGEIFVKVQNGFELQELHNVQITTTPSDNSVLSYETSTSLYKMKSIATLLGYTPANAARTLTINGTSYDLIADRTWNVGTVTSVAALTIGTSGTDITSTVANSTTTPVITLNVPDASAFARGVITTSTQTIAGSKYFSDNVAIGHTSPFDVSQFSLDVNGGLLVKNSSKTAQFVLINSNPALGGNNAFVIHTVGGTSGTSYADIQGYYGTSIAGSTVLRLNPQGGNVLIGNLAGTGSRMVVASATGVLSTQAIQTLSDLSGVPTARTLTINGVTFDLSANRSWTIDSMVYPSAGIAVSTGTAWGTSITDNSSNWNTAFGWGNHASAGYATTTYVNTQVANLVASAPATLDTLNELAAALGNDAAFSTTVTTALGNRLRIDTASQGLTSTQQGNGRTNLGLGSLAVLSSVANAQITDVAWSKVTGAPAFITSYTEVDTLASVTGRGASTTTALTINADEGLKVIYNGNGGDTWIRGWGIESNRGAVYLRPTTNNTQTLLIGYIDGNQNWGSISVGSAAFTWNGAIVATRTWVTSQNYLTSYTETDTLASVTGRGATTSSNLTFSGQLTLNKNGTQLKISRADTAAADWFFHSWTSGINIYPNAAGTVYFGRDGSATNVDVFNGTLYQQGNAVWHAGNFNPSSYLPLSGGTMSGKILTPSSADGTYGGALEIRERGYVSSSQSDWSYSPAITFHWGNRAALRFGLRADGLMAVDDSPIALRSWVTSQGYLTSYTDTLATVTGRGGSTTSFVSMTGGSRIVVQNSSDGGNNRGIFMWNTSDPNWGIYMAQSGAGKALNDGTAPTGLDGRTEHAIRFRVAASTSQPGFIWENSNNIALMQLQPNTGNLYTLGQIFSAPGSNAGSFNLSDTGAGLYRDGVYDVILHQSNSSGSALYLSGAGDVVVTIDNNNNDTFSKFRVGNNSTKAGNELFYVNESGQGYFASSLTATGVITITGTALDSPRFYMNGPSYTMVEMGDRTSGNSEVGYIKLRSGATTTHDFTANSTETNFINNGGRFAIGATSANGILHVQGSHVGGYGLINMLSGDACILSLDSTTSYDVRLRYKHNGSDKWFVGMRTDDNYEIRTGADALRFQLTQGGNATLNNGGLYANQYIAAGTFLRHSEGVLPVTEYAGIIVTPDDYPSCTEKARIYTIGTVNGGGSYRSYIEIEVFGSHRGYTPAGYVEYKKWIVWVGDRISSNLISSAGSDNNVGLWNGTNQYGLRGVYGDDVSTGCVLRLIVNPSCGAGKNYTVKVKYSDLSMTHGPFSYTNHSVYSLDMPRSPHHTQWISTDGRQNAIVYNGQLEIPSGGVYATARSSDTEAAVFKHPSNDYTIRSRASNNRDWAWYHSNDNFIFREPGVRTYMAYEHSSGKITLGDTDSQWDTQLRVHGNSGSAGYTTSDMNNVVHITRNSHAYILFSSPDGFDQGMHFVNTSANAIVGRIAYQHTSGGLLSFSVSSAIRLQLNSSGTLTASGDIVAYGSPSDNRLKTIKSKVDNAVEKVSKLNGYYFDWNEVSDLAKIKEDIGVIAQEVADVFPELARTNDDGFMSVRYQGLTAVLIEAVKEQQTQIESQKSEIEELKDLVKQLINR